MTASEKARLYAVVDGRVQGVGFRFFVLECARELALTGWVRNRWDDTVEVTAEGDRPSLEKLLGALQRGPRSAFVSRVLEDWQPYQGEFFSFAILEMF
jgi:acylphosphatase